MIVEFCDGYTIILQKRPSKYDGQGYIVRNSIEEVESDVITHRICYLTLNRRKDWATKLDGDTKKLFYQVEKKDHPDQRIFFSTAHMDMAEKGIAIAQQLYKDLDMPFRIFSGKDVIVLGVVEARKK